MENDKYISLGDCYINIDNSDEPPTHFILSTKKPTPSKNPSVKLTKKILKKYTSK